MTRRRPDFDKIHARNDALVWQAIRSRPAPTRYRLGLNFGGRPANFEEMSIAVHEWKQGFDYALSHFLDEF